MVLGIDISTYFEELDHGARYYDKGKEIDPIDDFIANGVECVRIRLWNNPYSLDGVPYLAGTCDLENFIKLARYCQGKGLKILLDFHYSDFWCDPAKQTLPKKWQGLALEKLIEMVYNYTKETLNFIKENGIDLTYIQVGNEITNGMLWPIGKLIENADGTRSNYENLSKLISSGSAACREIYPNAKVILHLEKSHDQVIYNEFFTNMEKYKVDFDIIGASYYPYWHGTFDEFFANMNMCLKFNKPRMVMELGYGFTLEGYSQGDDRLARLVVDNNSLSNFNFIAKYPLTHEGQALYVKDFLKKAKENKMEGVFYWEPLWLPGEGICWASEAGQEYIGESGKSTANEWSNQCLFDYEGNKLPAFDEFKK